MSSAIGKDPTLGDGGRHPGWPVGLGPLTVPGGTLRLRKPRYRDARAWSTIRCRDMAHLAPWEPTVPGTWAERNSRAVWFSQCSGLRALGRRGASYPFVITVDGVFAGQVTIGNIVRGALCSAWVGYWVAADRVRGGLATASVALAVDHCFHRGGLHRIEATVRPENTASIGVLTGLGFREEGLFRRYLDVAGDWRDHLCFAITAEETGEGLVSRLIRSGRAEFRP
ncbi:GNAT family N-acetyltransferase [Sciscionella sediminilitoris]|uniref:GNAT family N-acetyltransferase n=1 Tax=Sciscionella sediminilitoris TaxID=1445613 RepID=UPI0004DFC732|nr:GNAT family protein [Sciscionella sp. SE31]